MRRLIAAVGLVTLVSGCGSAVPRRPSAETPLAVAASMSLCPASDVSPRVLLGHPAGRVLVPGRPASAVLCRYWGGTDSKDGHPTHSLAGALRVSREEVASYLAAEMDALRAVSPRANCDEILGGRSELILFRYRGAGEARVRITRAGCVPVTNGRLVREGLGLKHGGGTGHWPDEELL
jgi:hypothetical protein